MRKLENKEIFVVGSPASPTTIRGRVLEDDLLPYKCSRCGLGDEWLGDSLSLQLDHINGNRDDNRLENLRWLCPNCHTQTETYAGKNHKNKGKGKNNRHCRWCKTKISPDNKNGICYSCWKTIKVFEKLSGFTSDLTCAECGKPTDELHGAGFCKECWSKIKRRP